MTRQFVLREGRRYLRMADNPRIQYMKLLARRNNLDPAILARRWARQVTRRALRDPGP